ncbi:MAG: Carboxyl-terminal protease [Acidobacteria bacterium]|jgi:carboxyl-terminal processing protease|nr:Carboxyl-terminal protease [Acidobacteriota bacterium]
MSFRGKFFILAISAVIAIYALVGGVLSPLATRAQQPINDAGAQIRIFESVLQHIQNDYVDEPNLEKVRYGALRGLASGLDPYSSYLTTDQVKDFQNAKTNNKVGIGAEFSQVSSYLYVVSVVKGSPAEKAGLKAGDVIEYIGNKATRDISLYDARQLITGDAGSEVSVRVLRAGAKPQTIKVVRGKYSIPQVEAKIEEGKIGVIKVYSLEDGEANDIRNQVQNLTKQGVQKIVLDLRGVAVGSLQEAVSTANLFIKDGELAKVIGKENKVVKSFAADPGKAIFDGKVVALIDLGTAGAGEVVASAILERKRGEVVGERSFGSGTEQQLFTLRGGDGYLLTTAKWASPGGTPFLGEERTNSGVKPSVEVKKPDTPEPVEVEELIDQQEEQNQNPQPDASPTPAAKPVPVKQEDVQLKKALELLQDKAQGAKAGSGE